MGKQRILQMVILVFVAGVFIFLGLGMKANQVNAAIGDPGYNFGLEDLSGKVHQLSDYKGKVVVINIFDTWCKPCVDGAPDLEAFNKGYTDQAKLLIIDKGEPKERVANFIKEHKTTSTFLFDFSTEASKKFGITGQPETFILDKNGIIREHFVGVVTKDLLAAKIKPWE